MLRESATFMGLAVIGPLVALTSCLLVAGAHGAEEPCGVLRLATCQFPVSADIRANGEWIRSQMRQAHDQGADLIHFPECALSGYAGVDLASTGDLDWDALRSETGAILALARELGVWVVLGSTHRLSGDHRPHNSLYVVGPEGRIIDRKLGSFHEESLRAWLAPVLQ